MLAQQRQAVILDLVRRRGAARVAELTEMLNVSDMTIRRDLDVLAAAGLVEKVHGGATNPAQATDEPGFEAKWLREQREKDAIAAAATALVKPGMAIGLSAGTTTWTLAHYLRDVSDLTIVVNSLQVAQVFYAGAGHNQTVVLTGGVRTPSDALVGPVAVSAVRQLHVDLLFLGVHGMSAHAGFSTPNLLESEVNRAFVEASRQLIVVADHTKWGVVGLSSIARLDQAHALITDDAMAPDAVAELRAAIPDVVLAPTTRVPAGTKESTK